MDPLAAIFIPGGLTAAAMLFGAPTAVIAHLIWRRRAQRRLARHACGHCGQAWLPEADQFLVTGIRICEPCALAFRRRLRLALPIITITAALFAVTSASALVVSLRHGGPELAWWWDGRWIPLLLPSVGLATVTALAVKAAKLSNRITTPSPMSPLHNQTQSEPNAHGV